MGKDSASVHCQPIWQRGLMLGVCVGASLLAGCSKLNALLGKTTKTALPVLYIGLVGTSDGPGGLEGSYSGNGALFAVDAINAAGGVAWHGQHYTLALVFGGGQDIAARVASIAFATPTIMAMLGPDDSAPALAALPITGSVHMPVLTLATAPDITDPAANHQASNVFRLRPSAAIYAQTVAQFVARQAKAPKVALALLDADYGQLARPLLDKALVAAGVVPVTNVVLPPGALDVSQQVRQVLAANADTVVCWSTAYEAAALVSGLRAAGWHGTFVDGMVDTDFVALAGPAGDGTVGAVSWLPELSSTANQHFVPAYTKRFGLAPDEHAAAMFDAITLLAHGVAAVGTDRVQLTGYLHSVKATGVTGLYDATAGARLTGAPGELLTTATLVRVQAGVLVPLPLAP